MRVRAAALCAAFVAATASAGADAHPVEYQFSGVVTAIPNSWVSGGLDIATGDTFSGRFTYDLEGSIQNLSSDRLSIVTVVVDLGAGSMWNLWNWDGSSAAVGDLAYTQSTSFYMGSPGGIGLGGEDFTLSFLAEAYYGYRPDPFGILLTELSFSNGGFGRFTGEVTEQHLVAEPSAATLLVIGLCLGLAVHGKRSRPWHPRRR